MNCYYDEPGFCTDDPDDLWQCETCGEWFCANHGHTTTLGTNVECVACERQRERPEFPFGEFAPDGRPLGGEAP